MHRPTARNRLGYRLSFEACEERQLLSVAPLTPPPPALVGAFAPASILFPSLAGSPTTGDNTMSAGFQLLDNSVQANVANSYGSISAAVDHYFSTDGFSSGVPRSNVTPPVIQRPADGGTWQILQPPLLDPINAVPPPILGPGPITLPMPELPGPIKVGPGAFETPASAPVQTPAPAPSQPISPFVPWQPASTSGNEPQGQQWLSASFSPAEQHRLDATATGSQYAYAATARDPQARFALEPTRLSTQAFCTIAPPPAVGDGEASSISLRAETGPQKQSLWRPSDRLKLDAAWDAKVRAARDAAILQWDAPPAPRQVPVDASGSNKVAPADEAASIDAATRLEEAEVGGRAIRFLRDHQHLVGTALAAMMFTSLVRGTNQESAGIEPAPQVETRLRRQRPAVGS